MAIFYTDSGSFNNVEVTGSTILSGSLIVSGATNFGPSGLTGSLFGTSSIAQTASFIEFTNIANRPALVSSSAFTSPSQGTIRATINDVQTDVDTGLQTGDSPQFTNLNVSSTVTASIISASTSLTASNVQLNGLTDTTVTNKVLVLNTTTNQIFTTSSVGAGASTPTFPYDGRTTPAIISGSVILSSSQNTPGLVLTGSIAMVSGGATFRSVTTATVITGNTISSDGVSAGVRIRYDAAQAGTQFNPNNEVIPETDGLGALGTSTQRWGSAIINQLTGSIISASTALTASTVAIVNNLTVDGGTLTVNAATDRVNMSGSITTTGSLTLLSSSLTINTGSISINTGSLTVDQLPGQTSGITLRVTGSNQVLYIGNDGAGSSFFKASNTQLRFGLLGDPGFAWDGTSLYPENTDTENLGATSNRWSRLVVNQVTASIVSASAGITGSLAQFNPVALRITVGTTAPTSPALNDLWVDTN